MSLCGIDSAVEVVVLYNVTRPVGESQTDGFYMIYD